MLGELSMRTIIFLFLVSLNFSTGGTESKSKKEVIAKLEQQYKKDQLQALRQYNKNIRSIKKGKAEELANAETNKQQAEAAYQEALKRYREIRKGIENEIKEQSQGHKLVYHEELKFLEESFYTKIKRYDPTRRRAKRVKK